MTRNKNDNVVEIDTEIYERLALIGMKLGRDNVIDFINDLLHNQMKKMQEEEEE